MLDAIRFGGYVSRWRRDRFLNDSALPPRASLGVTRGAASSKVTNATAD